MARIFSASISALALVSIAGTAPASAIDLSFGLGGSRDNARIVQSAPTAQAPVILAQASDGGVRISQMEEEMRRLTGKVEELSFMVLQLQEQLRKNQEDNEFRFQDLEGKGGGGSASAAPQKRTEATQPAPVGPAAQPTQRVASANPSSANDATSSGTLSLPTLNGAAPAPADLDTSFSEDAGVPAAPKEQSQSVASISANGPVELYSLGYNYMLAGDYRLAENTFRQYSQTYPTSQDAADAQYWLGESLFAQAKYRDAAETFLNAQKSHPKSGKAPEMMLKLGMSLARLDNRETACVTYAEVSKRYPEMSGNVKRKLQAEQKSARCS